MSRRFYWSATMEPPTNRNSPEFAEDEPDCICTEKSCECEDECECECACSKARREPPDTFWYDQ